MNFSIKKELLDKESERLLVKVVPYTKKEMKKIVLGESNDNEEKEERQKQNAGSMESEDSGGTRSFESEDRWKAT